MCSSLKCPQETLLLTFGGTAACFCHVSWRLIIQRVFLTLHLCCPIDENVFWICLRFVLFACLSYSQGTVRCLALRANMPVSIDVYFYNMPGLDKQAHPWVCAEPRVPGRGWSTCTASRKPRTHSSPFLKRAKIHVKRCRSKQMAKSSRLFAIFEC